MRFYWVAFKLLSLSIELCCFAISYIPMHTIFISYMKKVFVWFAKAANCRASIAPSIKQSPDLINISLQQKTRTSSFFIVCHAPYFRSFPLHGRPFAFSIAKLRCCIAWDPLFTFARQFLMDFSVRLLSFPPMKYLEATNEPWKVEIFAQSEKKGLFPVCVGGSEGRMCGRDYPLPSDGSGRM